MTSNFFGDLSVPGSPFTHFWEHTVGSGHASLGLRADWQKQLKRCHDELGFKHVRFHGILSDDMGTLLMENDKLIYSFFNADQVCDFLLSIGMVPFMELSFMPLTLSSGSDTVFFYRGNVTPPRSYEDWGDLISKTVGHWAQRYGKETMKNWFFEIWNEPNLPAFWTGSQADYFKLYTHAASAIKKIEPEFKVGGPATAANAWISDFRVYCEANNVPYDFISTHHYPTDAFGKPGDDTVSQLAASKRSILRDQVRDTRRSAGDVSVYYTEWSTSSNPFDDLHDLPYAAAFLIKTIMEAAGLVQGYSYWTFSDIFEENYFASTPFHGGFGLCTVQGIPKPSYRAYQLLHSLGTDIYPTKGSHPSIDLWLIKGVADIKILITNSSLPRHPIKNEVIGVSVVVTARIINGYVERIDDLHANAKAAWIAIGMPETLSAEQVQILECASMLVEERIAFTNENGLLTFEIEVPVQGTALVTFEIE